MEISIISESACSSCKSKKICSISEIKEKIIYIENTDNSFKIGEHVNVYIEERMGAYAVFFAYGFPFLLMVLVLFIGYYNKLSEPIMGLSVILLLTIYYVSLYLLRNQIGKKVTFKVGKLSDSES
ncbi:MAG TPA: hypothetical protein DIW31_05080 [Bacteroidales bacterium]|nr:hypothetical protein [Bacteroidales bacterium]